MSRNEFINELMDFAPKNMSEKQMDAIEQFCFGLYDKSNIPNLRTQLAQANERVNELEQDRFESLRLFANSIVRAFKGKDKLSKNDIISFSAKRIEQLRKEQE